MFVGLLPIIVMDILGFTVVNEPEVMEVEAPEVIVNDEPKVKKLICKSSFTDKFDNKIKYQVGDELNITDIARRNDLIKRGLAAEE